MVKHFHAKQTSPNNILLEISLDETYSAELPQLKDALALLPVSLPGMNIEVSYVDEIKKQANQKYELFALYKPDGITNDDK